MVCRNLTQRHISDSELALYFLQFPFTSTRFLVVEGDFAQLMWVFGVLRRDES